jgi:hypothetical protein
MERRAACVRRNQTEVRDARPAVYETLEPNRLYEVCGVASAGETEVTEIAVSTDGGQTWADAEF